MTEELKPIDVSKYRITETGQVLKMNKEELKDEMKNRISLALKDPILQQGFEIICKENAELKYRLEHRNCIICSNHDSNIKLIKAKELLAKWVELFKPKLEGFPKTPIQVDTEQFLKDSEVEK